MAVKTYSPPRGGTRSASPVVRFGPALKNPLLLLNPAARAVLETGGARNCIITYDTDTGNITFTPVDPDAGIEGSHVLNIRGMYNLNSLARVFGFDISTLPDGAAKLTVGEDNSITISTTEMIASEPAPSRKK